MRDVHVVLSDLHASKNHRAPSKLRSMYLSYRSDRQCTTVDRTFPSQTAMEKQLKAFGPLVPKVSEALS